ncbi:MAG: aminotransferase class IV, partial [Pyrinomonadaceae bacterium]|nr:aminotransferase class IV [Pyrinomonadaceae bacterium]
MHEHLSFNQQIKAVSEANLNAVSSASLYGRGVFTTIAIYKSKPFQWRVHWERLTQNAAKISLDVSELNESLLQKSFFELIAANTIENGRARITIFDSRFGAIWNFENEKSIDVLITTADFGQPKATLNLMTSKFSVNTESPLANVKSCNYLENLLALEDAKRRGFDEALRLNQRGEIVSAAMANVFWVKNEAIFTPSLKTGALKGTTRNFVLNLAKELNL